MTNEKKKLTVKEFLMWLEGVEEMQDAGWCPSATQWKRIRDKIDDIDSTVSNSPTFSSGPSGVVPEPIQHAPVSFAPSVYASSNMMPNPSVDLAGRPFLPETLGQAAKTPSIDTSNGKYGSPFA